MPDILDEVQDNLDREHERANKRVQNYQLPPGVPGDCQECGNHSPRLVGGHCGRCRDELQRTRVAA